MIPAPFAYARPSTIDEALQAVASGGEDVKILAGGQSLIPVMRLRLAAPETVVDLTRVAELRGVRDDGDAVVIGAMTTHSDVLSDPLIARYAPLIAEATETVRSRTPTRPATCRRWRSPWTPTSSSPGSTDGAPSRRWTSSSTT
jgi:carbon-monoxide dehydrogenase medium subunit